ncbi:IPT/TIG domain-containing protein, partial [Hymenobacter sp. ASUV-10]
LDLLTANESSGSGSTVSVRLNGGDATGSNTGIFSNGSNPAVDGHPYGLTLGDVDGDGDLDLLTANGNNSTVSVRLNGGDATGSNTGIFSNGSNPTVSVSPNCIVLGDVDGDGDLDLLTANFGASTVSVRLNTPAPTITSFSPPSGPVGTSVLVSGTNLAGATAVTVNGTAGTITANTATSLTFTIGAGSTTGLIRITTPVGIVASATSFTVAPLPTISSFSPASGPAGQTVTVTGTNFTGATSVTLNGAAITGFTIVNGTTITFTVPAGSSTGVIRVTTPGGTATSSGSFTFFPPPTITSFTPASANTGTTVTITGTNFTGATGVTVNGTAITGVTVVNGTTITFTLPAGVSSGTIAVTTPGGSTSSSTPLTVDNTPPTAVVSTTAGSSTGVAPIPFTVTFSEPVTGFDPADLTIAGGSLTGGTVSGSGSTYTFNITPTGSGSVVTVQVAAGAARDAANNPNPASNTVSVTYNGPPPAADLVNTGTQLTVQAGGILYVGTGGLGNQGGTLTNGGTLHVAGPLSNPATLSLGAGTLEVRGNLTNSGTVTPGTSAVTFSGLADQTLTPGGATLYQVLVNKPTAGANTLRLTGDLAVSNQLTLTTGVLATGSSAQVLLGPSATLSETTAGYVTGTVETTRPVSTAGTAQTFGGLGLRLTPAGTRLPGSTRVRRTTGTALTGAGTSQSIRRYFDIVPAVNTGLNVTLALTYRDDELNGIVEGNLALFKSQTGTAGPWARQAGVTLDAVTNTVTKTGISDFSIWTLGNASNPLPVTLLDFTAQAEGPAAVRLRWATAQELDNAGFTVERSLDGTAFADLGTVAGAGTTTTRHAYTWLDTPLPAGTTLLYYRLRQTDHDGTVAYSPVRAVPLGGAAGAASFVVFPTRVTAGQDAQYRYTGPAEAGTLHIVNVLGQVLGTVALDGRASGPVPLAGLPAGTYFLRYTGPAGRFTTRCVVD